MIKRNWFLFLLIPLFIQCEDTRENKEGLNGRTVGYGVDTTETVPQGLSVDEPAPAIVHQTVDGRVFNLQDSLMKGPVVVVFYRGKWCPICKGYLSRFRDSLNLITEKGATLVAVSPESTDNAAEMIERTDFPVPVIADTSGQIMRDYDVLFKVTEDYEAKILKNLDADIAANNAQEDAGLPVPATYIIGMDGKIMWRHFDLDYKNRASVKGIREQLGKFD